MKSRIKYSQSKAKPGMMTAFFMMIYFFCSLLFPKQTFSKNEPEPSFEEILVFMNVQGVGSVQIQAAIKNETAYLSITDVFDFLKIKNTPSPLLDSITGFFITPQAAFRIDQQHNEIIYT